MRNDEIEQEQQKVFERAMELLRQGEVAEARRLLMRLIRSNGPLATPAADLLRQISEESERREAGTGIARGPSTPRKRVLRHVDSKLADLAARKEIIPQSEITRTPHMDILPEVVQPGVPFHVFVYADTVPRRRGEQSEVLRITFPSNLTELTVSTHLLVTDHFRIQGEPIQDIVFRRDGPRSTSAQFQVITVPIEEARNVTSTPAIAAFFSYGPSASGTIRRVVKIAGLARPKGSHTPGTSRGKTSAPAMVVNTDKTRDPDLRVEIKKVSDNGHQFVCTVRSPHLPEFRNGKTGRWDLEMKAEELVAGYFRRFTSQPPSREQTMFALRGAGLQLFEASPKIFQEAFWALIKKEIPLKSILITSQEPFVPWELMVPTRSFPDKPRDDWERPLGALYAVGRWVKEEFLSPKQQIPLSDALTIAPVYPGRGALKHAKKEIAFISTRFATRAITPATVANIAKCLAAGGASVLHFACHGAVDPGEASSMEILLDGRKEQLDSITLRGMPAAKKAIESRNPFVFMNACEVGRTRIAMNGIGGLPPTFLTLGASAVLAPLWSVKDNIAYEVATMFYKRAKEQNDESLADILREIRRQSYEEPYEDSWAAYAFYGDPLAVPVIK